MKEQAHGWRSGCALCRSFGKSSKIKKRSRPTNSLTATIEQSCNMVERFAKGLKLGTGHSRCASLWAVLDIVGKPGASGQHLH